MHPHDIELSQEDTNCESTATRKLSIRSKLDRELKILGRLPVPESLLQTNLNPHSIHKSSYCGGKTQDPKLFDRFIR